MAGCGHKAELTLQQKAEIAFRAAVTNQVVGLNRIISTEIEDEDGSIAKWRADATVEYVNSVGGIDRTNLPFRFQLISFPDWTDNSRMIQDIACHLDDDLLYRQEMARIAGRRFPRNDFYFSLQPLLHLRPAGIDSGFSTFEIEAIFA